MIYIGIDMEISILDIPSCHSTTLVRVTDFLQFAQLPTNLDATDSH